MDLPTPVSFDPHFPPADLHAQNHRPIALLGEPTYAIVDGNIVITLPAVDAHSVVQSPEPITLRLDFKGMRATSLLADADASPGPESVTPDLLNGLSGHPGGVELQDDVLMERDDTYYLSMVHFEIQDHQFLVPRWRISESTTHFDLVLSQDPTEDSVITLDSVSPDDFRGLMRVMYPLREFNRWPESKASKQERISTLKLSTHWKMLQYRKQTLTYLQMDFSWPPTLSSVEEIVLGKACGVPTWYRRGCRAFAEGELDLETRHQDSLGIETMVKLMRARDEAYNPDRQAYHQRFSIHSHPYHTVLPKLFEAEAAQALSDMDPVERILVARNYGLTDWLLSCYHQLVEREESISMREVELLGMETAIKLWKARLELFRTYRRILEQVDPPRPGPEFAEAVEREFGDEFAEAQLLHDWLIPLPSPVPTPPVAEPSPPPTTGWGTKKKLKKKGASEIFNFS